MCTWQLLAVVPNLLYSTDFLSICYYFHPYYSSPSLRLSPCNLSTEESTCVSIELPTSEVG